MKWFTANPVLMGCLVPVILFPVAFVASYLLASRLTNGFGYSIGVLLGFLVPAIWALVVWARWFGRR